MKKNYVKITLDFLMALTFALLMDPKVLSGLPFHEIAGLIFGVAILTHIALNFRWVKNTTVKIFDPKLPFKTRLSYLLNILLLISMSTIIITGIFISRVVFPGLAINSNHMIRGLHNLAANGTLVLVGCHLGVHWQWIKGVCRKIFKSKTGQWKKGVLASVILSIALLAGGIQWYSSVQPASGDFKQFAQKSDTQSFNSGNVNGSHFQGPPNGTFHGHDEGKFGHHGGGSPFLVILQYLGIFAIIIIPVYFIDKRFLSKRQNQKSLQLKHNEG
ncbi:cytochrome b/b6 domain-containing protein [Bacillus sp. APMAM]|nr:cytochrome b/b6 domain-containing protein [Bacillus sp. APMAM]